jgi:hypothetical protein
LQSVIVIERDDFERDKLGKARFIPDWVERHVVKGEGYTMP